MITPLRDTKIIDAHTQSVFECILFHVSRGWSVVKEKRISEIKIRLVFQRIHVDNPNFKLDNMQRRFKAVNHSIEFCGRKRIRMPKDHYEAHGVPSPDHEELVQELLRVDSNDEYGRFYDRVKGK